MFPPAPVAVKSPIPLLRAVLPALALPALVFVLVGLFASCLFLRNYLGPVTLSQLLYHLQYGGMDYADPRMLWRALRYGAGTLLLTALLCGLLRRMRPWVRKLVWGGLLAGVALSVTATVESPCEDPELDLIAADYVDPAAQRFERPAGPMPDLLLVFMESLDQRFVQARWMPQLSKLGTDGTDFGHLYTLNGANWTVGGLFSTLCGLPLQPVGLMSRHALEYATRFFDGGTCLTDVLAREGWSLSFYGGASLKFAGKGLFLERHGVTRRFGREQWQQRGVPVPEQGWGLLDAALAEQAWQDMQRPREDGRPRVSLMLTVNTHGPNGTPDPGCGQGGTAPLSDDEQMALALDCSDRAVARLVRRFLAQADGRPKLVWLQGDHVSPLPLLFDGSEDQWKARDLFQLLLRADGQGHVLPALTPRDENGSPTERQYSHFDVFATLLDAMGLRWSPASHRLGLGVSLLAPEAPATLLEREGVAASNRRLSCPSPLFHRLWFSDR